MQFGRTGIMRVAACQNADPARTTGACGQVHIVESDAVFRKFVKIRCFHLRVTVGANVVPADVIADHKNDIWGLTNGVARADDAKRQ